MRMVILSAVASLSSVPRKSCAISSSASSSRLLSSSLRRHRHLLQSSFLELFGDVVIAAPQDFVGGALQVVPAGSSLRLSRSLLCEAEEEALRGLLAR